MSDVPEGKVPIFESIGVAFNYFVSNWTRWIPGVLIVAAAMGWLQVANGQMSQSAISGELNMSSYLLATIVTMLVMLVFSAGVLRHAIRGEFSGPIGLSLGADELRLLGVWASLALIFGIGGSFVAFLVMVAVMMVVAGSGVDIEQASTDPEAFMQALGGSIGGGGALVLLVLFFALFAAMIFIWVRLMLVQAATIGERKMMIFQTWGWTKGNFWRVFAAAFLLAVAASIVSSIVVGVLSVLIGGSASAQNALMGLSAPVLFAIGGISGIMNGFTSILMLALVAHLYQGLRPGQAQASVFE